MRGTMESHHWQESTGNMTDGPKRGSDHMTSVVPHAHWNSYNQHIRPPPASPSPPHMSSVICSVNLDPWLFGDVSSRDWGGPAMLLASPGLAVPTAWPSAHLSTSELH